jgi:hypothetical protein
MFLKIKAQLQKVWILILKVLLISSFYYYDFEQSLKFINFNLVATIYEHDQMLALRFRHSKSFKINL